MQYFLIFVFYILSLINSSFADNIKEETIYRELCVKDLDFIREVIKSDSIIYVNDQDTEFHKWYESGYHDTLKLISLIQNGGDCRYAIQYYVYGFNRNYLNLRYYNLQKELQYPGILSVISDGKHRIFYKRPDIKYLQDVNIGDQLTHINGMDISQYYNDYLLPFYKSGNLTSTGIYALIHDNNLFRPIPQNITIKQHDKSLVIELQYTSLDKLALDSLNKIQNSGRTGKFKIAKISNGVWIKIPSFFLDRQESISYISMLSQLKYKLAQEKYIVFDMRGNLGGTTEWSRPIIRNLWGDNKIKSLGNNHVYNMEWQKKLRISKRNFEAFKRTFGPKVAKFYASAMRKKEKSFLKKWSIFRDTGHLYTNNDSSEFPAKIYVLTDKFCRSTCWAFVSEITQMPGVVHIGHETSVQSIYSYAKRVTSPSTQFDFFFPTQIRVQPTYKLGEALIPSIKYDGDMKDETNLISWVLSITEKSPVTTGP